MLHSIQEVNTAVIVGHDDGDSDCSIPTTLQDLMGHIAI